MHQTPIEADCRIPTSPLSRHTRHTERPLSRPSPSTTPTTLLHRLAWLAHLASALILALRLLVADRWGWLGMLNAFTEWTRGANLALALLRLRQGHGDAMLFAVPALLTRVAPKQRKGAATGRGHVFTLMGTNLYLDNRRIAQHVALIGDHQPDIVAFHELTVAANEALHGGLRADYPYRVAVPRNDAYGFGIFSRFPLRNPEILDTPGVRPWAQRLLVDLPDGTTVALYNVHLCAPTSGSTRHLGFTWGFRAREAQIEAMAARIQSEGYPAVIIGDHNFTEASAAYDVATTAWRDAWAEAGQGPRWTWPLRGFPYPPVATLWPVMRLDYCFLSGVVAQSLAHLAARTGSDHRVLLATLQVAT